MSLNMVQLAFEASSLYDWARRVESLSLEDAGYVVHAALRACFGELAPQPFAVLSGASRFVNVLGYGPAEDRTLLDAARELAEPLLYRAVTASKLLSKPMPERFEAGRTYGFRILACPIRRGRDENGRVVERDAFLSQVSRSPEEKIDRTAVYLDWLEGELGRAGAAQLIKASMVSFRLVRPRRLSRSTGRAMRLLGERPEVCFEGGLRVSDPEAFTALLRRGIGRHRAFGYGMVLLRPHQG